MAGLFAHHVHFLLDAGIVIGTNIATLQIEGVHVLQLCLLHATTVDELGVLALHSRGE